MSEFDPRKLHITFIDKKNSENSISPRSYTLTHSDITGDLFLSIGPGFDYRKFSSLYSKLMRDEVLGKWQGLGQTGLNIYCLVSGGIAIGPAKWRESIFRQHMNMVLKAICYGDRVFLAENRDFLWAPIYVHFLIRNKKTNSMEKWGIISDFMPKN
ncbi:MAG: staygreen family protein [Actinomycetia bacterium]|nr:staygreen family protein [Actinomycetes bacterium]